MLSRLASWLGRVPTLDLIALLASNRIERWREYRRIRHARAFRELTWRIPVERLDLVDGLWHFEAELHDRPIRFALRRGTSDVLAYLQVIVAGEYAPAAPFLDGVEHPRIIDAGGNVGLTTLWFKTAFPDASVIALEPEPDNMTSFRRHLDLNGIEGVEALPLALWTAPGAMEGDWGFRRGEAWGFAVRPANGAASANTVQATTISALLDDAGWETVDLLKVDIEGAEAELLRDPATLETLKTRVRSICLEIHPECIDWPEAEAVLLECGFGVRRDGETLFGSRPAEG